MPRRTCVVTVRDSHGVTHTVSVEAGSVFEAGILGLSALQGEAWVEKPGPATRLEIEVTQPTVRHVVTVQQLQRWLDGVATSPNELVRRQELRALLERG